jgi:hypothetical protein
LAAYSGRGSGRLYFPHIPDAASARSPSISWGAASRSIASAKVNLHFVITQPSALPPNPYRRRLIEQAILRLAA